jgi:hypothetical protein
MKGENVSGDARVEYTILGRSGLKVSIAGLGCGGPSRLGQATGKSEQESIAVVRQAVDLGVTLFDTAEVYGTEAIVGKALQAVPRDQVVISTKKLPPPPDHPDPAGELKQGLEQSLRRLRTDSVDIYHLHGVRPEQYRFAYDVLAPVLLQMREEGKIRASPRSRLLGCHNGRVQSAESVGPQPGVQENAGEKHRGLGHVCRAPGAQPTGTSQSPDRRPQAKRANRSWHL